MPSSSVSSLLSSSASISIITFYYLTLAAGHLTVLHSEKMPSLSVSSLLSSSASISIITFYYLTLVAGHLTVLHSEKMPSSSVSSLLSSSASISIITFYYLTLVAGHLSVLHSLKKIPIIVAITYCQCSDHPHLQDMALASGHLIVISQKHRHYNDLYSL